MFLDDDEAGPTFWIEPSHIERLAAWIRHFALQPLWWMVPMAWSDIEIKGWRSAAFFWVASECFWQYGAGEGASMTGDNCAVCGERTRYDGHEIAHSCAGGVPASNLPERDHGLVSISEMNRRIAEAVAAERERCVAIYEGIFNLPKEIALRSTAREQIRGAKC